MPPGTAVPGAVLGPHAAVFACPQCHGRLTLAGDSVTCGNCSREYLDPVEGHADFVVQGQAANAGHAPLRLQDPVIAGRYERFSRPAFLEIMGGNWGGSALTAEDEREYLRGSLAHARTPVADVACGAGGWTRVIAGAVGASGVIGADISKPLLQRCRAAVPGITAVRASALGLPFAAGALGAAVIWNALQQMPDPARVIAEAARCLQPGGTLVLLTYRPARDQLARYFQARHENAFGVTSFAEDQLRSYLDRAGLVRADVTGPANFLLATARKPDAARTAAFPQPGPRSRPRGAARSA